LNEFVKQERVRIRGDGFVTLASDYFPGQAAKSIDQDE
jgi:hypothetical protein